MISLDQHDSLCKKNQMKSGEGIESLFPDFPIFCSEADFQFSLAWRIKELYPEVDVKLEYRPWDYDKRVRIDIVILKDNRMIPIELKYKTKRYDEEYKGEKIELKNQSAHDSARYDFIRDIKKLEDIIKCDKYRIEEAYAIFLTNDPLYWNPVNNTDALDSQFRIHEGVQINGERAWKEGASKGTIKDREDELEVDGTYDIKWHTYWELSSTTFKYTVVKIDPRGLTKNG